MSCITKPRCSDSGGSEFKFNVIPTGPINCVNNDFTLSEKFVSGTLVVRVDGIALNPINYTEGADLMSFSIVPTPGTPNSLKSPLTDCEALTVDYQLQSTSVQGCISYL